VTEQESKYYEKLLTGKMKRLLSHMAGHSREILDVEEARDSICSVCEMPLKPCIDHPGMMCCTALKGGSELLEIEAALARIENGEFGVCSLCGKRISKEFLKTHPTTVFCTACFRVFSTEERKSKKRAHTGEGSVSKYR
jgi:hypothetical protein